jgi:hypothetical protein
MKTQWIVVLGILAGLAVNARAMVGQSASAPNPSSGNLLGKAEATAKPFTVCKATYALCTRAKCTKKGNGYDCTCVVRTGWSAGAQSCASIRRMAQAHQIASRYHPIRSFVTCKGGPARPSAFCLDSKCTASTDGKHAHCACSAAHSKYFVVTTDHDTPGLCRSDTVVSSASIEDVITITHFLKSSRHLPASDFPVLNVRQPQVARPTQQAPDEAH